MSDLTIADGDLDFLHLADPFNPKWLHAVESGHPAAAKIAAHFRNAMSASVNQDRRDACAKIASAYKTPADTAARDMRIAVLEQAIEDTHKVFDGVGVAWSTGSDAGRLPLPKRAARAVEPGFLADAERKRLEARIADLERTIADKSASLKTAHDALNRICEVICAPPPVTPEDAVNAVCSLIGECETAKHDAEQGAETIRALNAALDDAGAPRAYTDDNTAERLIPATERILLLGERARAENAERIREGNRVEVCRRREAEAVLALDDAGAPRLADGAPLSVAARVRGLKT